MSWFYLSIAIACEVMGTFSLSLSQGFTKPLPTAFSLSSFCVSFFLLSLALKTIPVGIAYAIWAGAGIVLVSLLGFVFLRQMLDAPAIIGMGLIVTGVLVIHLFSNSATH